MGTAWRSTKYSGVRYRLHPQRKHGVTPDKYFSIRYQFNGKRREEGLGWASQGWTPQKAFLKLAELKNAAVTGQGAARLSEQRKARADKDAKIKAEQEAENRRNVTYTDYFNMYYWPDATQDKKTAALNAEASLHKNWIIPAIGTTPVRDIRELHIIKLSRQMKRADKAPRSIEYALACVRMVLNHALRSGYHAGPNPVTTMARNARPKYDNKRVRFFSRDEAANLLTALKKKSISVHNMTLLSIYCGLRAGEIFALQWSDVDLVHGLLSLRDTKSGKTRTVHMPSSIKEMFATMEPGRNSELVFPSSKGKKRKQISKTFDRTINELGLNDGVLDRRQKLTFHSCRHTCASWLVQAGIPLFTVKEIMGHSTIALTERYSHLAPSVFQQAAEAIEQTGTIEEVPSETVNLR